MTDELRKRAATTYAANIYGNVNGPFVRLALLTQPTTIDAMLAFADKEVKKERARCAKVCRNLNNEFGWGAASMCAEAIEKGEK